MTSLEVELDRVMPAIPFDPDRIQEILDRIRPAIPFHHDMLHEILGFEEENLETERIKEAGSDEDLESKSEGIKEEDEKKLNRGRRHRAQDARRFTDRYKFASGQKICIDSQQSIHCFSDYCFDSTWVGVHGMQSICIVTRRDMDMTRLHPFYQRDIMKRQNMEMFARAAIAEVECLPHEEVDFFDVAFRRSCTGSVKKPFAVVSLGQDAHEGCVGCCCVCKTIEYLESVASSDLLCTHYGILEVAIKAYQLMCHKELRADETWVTIVDFVKNPYWFDHLPMDIIGEQLDLVNGLSSEKVPQKPLFVYRGGLQ